MRMQETRQVRRVSAAELHGRVHSFTRQARAPGSHPYWL